MGGHARERSGRLRLGLLVAIAALFVLIPAAQAAPSLSLKVNVEGEGLVYCEAEFEGEIEFEFEECGETELLLPEGSEVFLVAVELGDEFKEFKGCDVAEFEECELTMDESREVTAVFAPEIVNPLQLSISYDGTGSGEVECELEEGPGKCQAEYPEGTELTLIAEPDAGSEFVEFTGECEPVGSNKCEVVLDEEEDRFVIATFDLIEGEEEGEGEEETGGGGGTNPAPTPSPIPPAIGPGKARVSGAGLYRGGKATLRLTCKGGGPCKGTVKLIAKLKLGKKRKQATVGKAAFSLPANGSKAIKVKLSRPAKKLLRKGRTLTAKVRGRGVVASKVRITPSAR